MPRQELTDEQVELEMPGLPGSLDVVTRIAETPDEFIPVGRAVPMEFNSGNVGYSFEGVVPDAAGNKWWVSYTAVLKGSKRNRKAGV